MLDGFVYHRLEQPILAKEHKSAALSRKAWLARDTEYHAQPYIQLARRLTAQGYSEDAGQVRVFKEQQEQRRRWKALANLSLSWPIRGLVYCVIWLFGLFFGYGYRPTAAFWTLMGGIVSGWLFFWLLNGAGLMVVDQ
ncbi:MAG: hypothetical protein SF002_13085 [Alphaproteobacteria bacterium]|nr:hypothetical protein [Alphaproteobacteria bacterium]